MKKQICAIFLVLSLAACSTTSITNTKNIKQHILKDNLAYDTFDSYDDSDSIIRLPNGKYIHGTKILKGKNYDSDLDTGAINAKQAEYYVLLAMDANQYVSQKFNEYSDSDKIIYDNGSILSGQATITDENGNEKLIDTNSDPDAITVKEAKIKVYNQYIKKDAKKEKQNLSKKSQLSKLLPKTKFITRVLTNKNSKFEIHYYNVEESDFSDYITTLTNNGFISIDPNASFLAKNNENDIVNVHYDSEAKIISTLIYKEK